MRCNLGGSSAALLSGRLRYSTHDKRGDTTARAWFQPVSGVPGERPAKENAEGAAEDAAQRSKYALEVDEEKRDAASRHNGRSLQRMALNNKTKCWTCRKFAASFDGDNVLLNCGYMLYAKYEKDVGFFIPKGSECPGWKPDPQEVKMESL